MPASAVEVDGWRDAAVAYIAEAEAAADEVREVRARGSRRQLARRVPVVRARLAARRRSAEVAYASRMAAAAAAYRPVLEEIDVRIATVREEERVARQRAAARAETERLARYAEFQEWTKRRTDAAQAADLRLWTWEHEPDVLRVLLHDVNRHAQPPLTARELAKITVVLAGRGSARVTWEPAARRRVEEEIAVGTFALWWRGLLDTTVNARAREAAEQEIVTTAERVGAALAAAGEPGVAAYSAGNSDFVRGWRVLLDWPTHVPPPVFTPPPLPWASSGDRWWYRSYGDTPGDYSTLTLRIAGWLPGSVGFAEVGTEIVYHTFTRRRWSTVTAALFARLLLDDEISHRGPGQPEYFTLRVGEHAQARHFVPFVTALAAMVTTALLDLARDNGVPQ
ncbi:hypothetical protein [Kitasatospora aburaviensis]|uniref:Uncharacterized protein n=1 Tax=Kitasatospora aburaviensis TaxID=67265 RepID=A0ABW1FAU2_9ACTN